MDPDEASHRCGSDAGLVEVTAGCGNDAANEETKYYGTALHDGRAKSFADDNRYEDQESEADVLSAAPR